MTREDRSPEGYLRHSEAELLEAAARAIAHARTNGAEAAAATASESAGITMKLRGGTPFSATRNGSRSLSVTIYLGGRSGHAASEAIDSDAVKLAVEKACAIARLVEPDAEAGLADAEWLADDPVEIPLFAPSGRSAPELAAAALGIETAALGAAASSGARVRIDETSASSADMRWARVFSNGFEGAATASIQTRSCIAIAEGEDEMVRDWGFAAERREEALDPSAATGADAVARATAKLGASSISTRTTPVLLDNRVAVALVQDLVSGLTGGAQHQRSTFLAGSLGAARLAAHIDLSEDPFEPFGMASGAWDSEGVAPTRRPIVDGGLIAGYFLGSRSARKLGMRPTGNADGPMNLRFSSRNGRVDDDRPAMLRKLHRGLWVTDFLGGGVNPATGSFSKAVSGFWVENGLAVHPVSDVTIAGELPRMLLDIEAIGSDVYRQGAIRTGSILIDNMRIAGR